MIKELYYTLLKKAEPLKPVLVRYFLYGFALIESFTLPKLLDEYNYSQYEYYKNFIFIFPSFLLGAYNGYVQLKYVNKVDYYNQLFSVGVLFIIVFASIFSLFFQNIYLFIPFIIIGIYTVAEQNLKIKRKFTIIFLYKPLLSVITVGFAAFSLFPSFHDINFNYLLLLSFTLSFGVWFLLCPNKAFTFPVHTILEIRRYTLYRYGLMIKVYFTGVLTSLLLSLMFFFERYIMEKYYPQSIASYSFAFNLSQIVVMILGAISYVTAVELGERRDTIDKAKLKNQFSKALLSYLVFLVAFTIFLFLIAPYYGEFRDLIKITLIITYAKGFYFLVGTISSLANYYGYNTYMFKGLTLLFVIELVLVYTLMYLDFPFTIILFINSIILIIYAFFLLNIIFNKIRFNVLLVNL